MKIKTEDVGGGDLEEVEDIVIPELDHIVERKETIPVVAQMLSSSVFKDSGLD